MQVASKNGTTSLRDTKKADKASSAATDKIQLGISEGDAKKVADMLVQVVADSYALLLKTHNYHWNVRGPMFKQVHELTELQYNTIFTNIDLVAERVRALGQLVPASLSLYAGKTNISEPDNRFTASQMVADLVKDHELTARQLRKGVVLADDSDDKASADLLTKCIAEHEKAAWMLRSLLD
ncbi:MAG: Dps family protein [Bacteroidota bacterium]